MKLRINALPDEAADFMLWLSEHKKEIRIATCSHAYLNSRNPHDETVRFYLDIVLTEEGKKQCGK